MTVTYGARAQLLAEVIASLAKSTRRVDRIVVVDNASTNLDVSTLQGTIPVEIVEMSTNTGSAAGYAAGLVRAADGACDLIWLLDDDNVPAPDALERLLAARRCLGDDERHVFAAMRLDRPKYVNVAYGDGDVTLRRNAYLGFTVRGLLKRIVSRRAGRSQAHPSVRVPIKKIEYAIYGGLLLHKRWLAAVGYPDERLFLYVDDTEFTYRITKHGGSIFLVGTSVVKDIDTSWATKTSSTMALPMDPAADESKLYYIIRNSCFFHKRDLVDANALFYLNASIYFLWMACHGLLNGCSPVHVARRLRLMAAATRDGLDARLGRVDSTARAR